MSRIVAAVAVGVLVVVVSASQVGAGPGGPPSFGVVDPLDNNPTTVGPPGFSGSCPWPDAVVIPGVEKCLPKAIAWSPNGVRIVSDPLVSGDDAYGDFTFWCQSRVGLHFLVTVHDMPANTTYDVTYDDGEGGTGVIGQVRTDPNGNGVTGGVVPLDPGDYEWTITVGPVHTLASDDIGFEVL